MKRILVTGCAGFIGSHLCEELVKNNEVIGIDNFDLFYDKYIKQLNINNLLKHPNFKFLEIDIRSNLVSEIPETIDFIIHLAAKAGVRPSILKAEDYIDVNINGTHSVIKFAIEKNIKKFIFASSSSIYGNNNLIPFCEHHQTDNPVSPYAFTKKSCELMNYSFHHLHQIDFINLRFFTVFGPRQRPDLAIHKFVKAIYNAQPITLYGDGKTYRDYTYVADIVDGIVKAKDYLAANNHVFETINLGNNSPVSLKDLVEEIKKITARNVEIIYLPMQDGDVNYTYANIDKAKRMLGYQPQTSMKSGLAEFVKWYAATQN
jgi:nucleoside-diphosphate-sugar epimerase